MRAREKGLTLTVQADDDVPEAVLADPYACGRLC